MRLFDPYNYFIFNSLTRVNENGLHKTMETLSQTKLSRWLTQLPLHYLWHWVSTNAHYYISVKSFLFIFFPRKRVEFNGSQRPIIRTTVYENLIYFTSEYSVIKAKAYLHYRVEFSRTEVRVFLVFSIEGLIHVFTDFGEKPLQSIVPCTPYVQL